MTFPALFPARIAGETHGEHSALIEFARGLHRFRGLSKEQLGLVAERWGHLFSTDPSKVCAETEILRASRSDFVDIETRGWDYTLDFDYAVESVAVAGPGWMARLHFGKPFHCGLWTCCTDSPEFAHQFENFFRILLAYRLHGLGGALVHSAAVVDEGCAFVFFGRSGAGKTTLSRLSSALGMTVLSDDMNALEPDGDRVRVQEVPFAGDIAARGGWRTFPLRALVRLQQGREHGVVALRRTEAAAGLISCSPFLNRDPYRAASLAGLSEQLTHRVPTFSLTFTRDAGFWPLLKRL